MNSMSPELTELSGKNKTTIPFIPKIPYSK